MAVRPVAVFFGDSNMAGLADIEDVPSATFNRLFGQAYSTQTWPINDGSGFDEWPKDYDMQSIKVLTPSLPYEPVDERNITAVPAADQLTLDGANLVATDQDRWVYVSKNTTGYGQHLRINADPSSGTTVTLLDPLTAGAPLVANANNGKVHLLNKSHTVASATTDTDNDTSTITKTSLTPDFTAVEDDYVTVIATSVATLAAVQLSRRVVSATADTVTMSPALTVLPAAGDGIREQTAASTARILSELDSTTCALTDLRIYHDAATSYSGPRDYPNPSTLTGTCTQAHANLKRWNGVPTAVWPMQSEFSGPFYVVMEGVGGATAAPNEITTMVESDVRFAYHLDIEHQDFRPGVTANLYDVLKRKLDAAKTLIEAAGDTMDVVCIASNVGTNDAAHEHRADIYKESMLYIIDTLRDYLVAQSMTTRTAARIPFAMSTVNSTLAVRPYKATVNTGMAEIVAERESVFLLDISDTDVYSLQVDDLHLDADGQVAWGELLYTNWLPVYESLYTFVVETGTGSTTANSYCSVATADTYHQDYGNPTAWVSATQTQKEDWLRQATRAVDLRWGGRYPGYSVTSTQALLWPMYGAVDKAGNSIDSDTIPVQLQDAVAYLAGQLAAGESILPTAQTEADQSSRTVSVGGVSKSVTYRGARPAYAEFPAVDYMLERGGVITAGGVGWGSSVL